MSNYSKVEFTITDAEKDTDYVYELQVTISIAPAEREIGIPDPYVDKAYIESGKLQVCDWGTDNEYFYTDVEDKKLHLPEELHQEFYETLIDESFKVAKAEQEEMEDYYNEYHD